MPLAQTEPVKVLVDEILQDAQAKAERSIERAKSESAKVISEAQEEARLLRGKVLRESEEESLRRRQVIQASLGIERKRLELAAREKTLAEVIEAGKKRLSDKEKYDYASALVELAGRAASAIDGARIVIEFAREDQTLVKETLLDSIVESIKKTTGRNLEVSIGEFRSDFSAGVVVRSADGHQVFNNSFEARSARLLPEIRSLLAREALFSEPPS